MKFGYKKIFSIALLLFWMGFIFLMSTDFGASDGKPNQKVIQVVKEQTGVDMNSQVGKVSINAYFRKNMHFFEFAVLGLLILNVLALYRINHRYEISLAFSSLYAGFDELHQMYVMSRTSLFTDVLIDTCGAALALTLVYIIAKHRHLANKLKRV